MAWMIAKDDNSNYLAHHGVKGQKWGVRRYQNPDGTLTEEGKKRYRPDKDGYIRNVKRRKELANIIANEANALQKEYTSTHPNSPKESTGENYDKAYDYVAKELKKWEKDERCIFSNIETWMDVENIMGEIYMDAALKDMGYENVEPIKKMLAANPDTYEKSTERIKKMMYG